MKRVLLTGAAGFIGRQAIQPLLNRGYEVHAVSRSGADVTTSIAWHQVDLLDDRAVSALVSSVRPTHVLHFAWITEPGEYWTSSANEDWNRASKHLFSECVSQGCTRVVMAGTCAEYDWQGDGVRHETNTPCVPHTLYGKCKNDLQNHLAQCDISSAWGRVFFLYGPYEHPKRLVASTILSLLHNEKARCTHGEQIRDFLHVADVADAFVALLDSDVCGPVNIASGTPHSIRDVVGCIGEQVGTLDMVEFGAIPSSPDDPSILLADTDRLHKEVLWYPKYSLDKGIEQTIQWWREHPDLQVYSGV